jgi:putative ABC transport system substrate-binding protein
VKRRDFITLLGGAAAWPVEAWGQQAGKLPTIGLLVAGTPATHGQWVAAFVQRLSELSWIVGRTIVIEYRWLEGRTERFAETAAEFVRLKVDVIVTNGNASVIAAKQATTVIPIVFTVAGDPVGTGLVGNLARPGGNVTGLSIQQTDTATKRLELLREVVADLRRLAIIANVGNPAATQEMGEVKVGARSFGMDTTTFEIRRVEDIPAAFDVAKGRFDALYFVGDPLMNSNRVRINTLAAASRLPTMYSQRAFVEGGGLISYGANFRDLWRRGADYVDKILRGMKPAEIPVEQPTKFDLVINLTTAKALGLEIPSKLLFTADEVIE